MDKRFVVIACNPLGLPDARVTVAACRAGAMGVLDLGADATVAAAALRAVQRRWEGPFGVRISAAGSPPPDLPACDLPESVDTIVFAVGARLQATEGRQRLAEVTSVAEARAATAANVDGLIAVGSEAGGRVGTTTSFVLLQQIVEAVDVPVWVRGGVGLHTAAGAVAGGAAGIVLADQLALVQESALPEPLQAAIRAMDGSETRVVGGHRIFTRPDLPAAAVADDATPDEIAARLGPHLRRDLVPLGQAAAFAPRLARRFRTTGGVIQAIVNAVDTNLELAGQQQALAPNSEQAAEHGTTYPIAQGPMTRVSDGAAFAKAVADGGGLPFLALSLSRAPQVRALLEETRDLLGDLPWGVGILGFVPAELRDAQLAVLADIQPPVALIAGGRPSQARQLEAMGTPTYLHVPSPGLLAQFLRDGARRFVFEGSECGGHIGPRSSFALWELQIDVLLEQTDAPLDEVSVYFAGGIHDGRSAAIVAAMAAGLVARGARIGVLMGTAYLFTREAVDTGAIEPGFQLAAVSAQETVTLQTAPGHATRCAESPFVETFRAEHDRLVAEGVDSREVWAQLETLNLGRLRIASKGLRREGDALVDVPGEQQWQDGMYMMGQVAALRADTCTIADLHASVSDGAVEHLAPFATIEPTPAAATPARVALVGMACLFPGADDLESFWSNTVLGRDLVTEVPPERWRIEDYWDPEGKRENAGIKTPSKWGGFLPAIAFDPLKYGIPPRSLPSIEPVQLLSLEVARRALADAGYDDGREFNRERTSCIFGVEAGTELSGAYGFRALFPHYLGELPDALDDALPRLTEDSFPGVLANVIAGRVANRLDLGGVNYTVDAACASSLAALDLAVKELVGGTSDMVLCGGADLHNSINDYLMFASVHALSATGRCRTFDSEADGIVLGEGVACVVLKRLADAERDGDRIYAIVDGVAGSSDGRALGLTAPRKQGQKRALTRAYDRAGISPSEVGLVEAHGTGTVVGDRTELQTLSEIFEDAGSVPASCALGSVKSQIGHTKCAAGLAGLIKTALSVHRGVLPPTIQIKEPNPGWDPVQSPFTLSSSARPWPSEQRVAAVSAFGFGGTNFHAVLRAWDGDDVPEAGLERWPAELFLVRGADRAAAAATLARLATWAAADRAPALRELAWATARRDPDSPVQVAIVANGRTDLLAKIDAALAWRDDPRGVFVARDAGGDAPTVAFLFPGQGSQKPGMLRELFVAMPRLQRLLALAPDVAAKMLPPTAWDDDTRDAAAATLTDTRAAQPALGMADLAMAELLAAAGVRADMMGGHSYGELAALCAAGAWSEQALLDLSRHRAEAILAAAGDDPGTMAAVRASADEVLAALGDRHEVVLANMNAPDQTVIAGPTDAVEGAVEALSAARIKAKAIPVACAFHSPVVAAAADTLRGHLDAVAVKMPSVPVYSNVTAGPHPSDADGIRTLVSRQVAEPVRFADQLRAMRSAGATLFVEVGPGAVLSGLVRRVLGDDVTAIPCDGNPGLRAFLTSLARLAISNVPVDAATLFSGRRPLPLELAAEPVPLPRSTWLINGHLARPAHGEPPAGGLQILEGPVAVTPGATALAEPVGVVDDTVREYLQGLRDVVAAQRDVMLRYLGDAPAPSAAQSRVMAGPVIDVAAEAAAEPEVVDDQPPASTDVSVVLLGIVSERTGYPPDMLDLDLDVEADLGVDSIKRLEILGELRDQLGLPASLAGADEEEAVERLSRLKSLRSIIEAFQEAGDGDGNPAATASAGVGRFVLRPEPSPVNESPSDIKGKSVAITPGGDGVADALVARLVEAGATARVLGPDDTLDEADTLIDLTSLAREATDDGVKRLFRLAREAATGPTNAVFAAAPQDGVFGDPPAAGMREPLGGMAGLLKSLKREHDDLQVRMVNLPPTDDVDQQVDRLLTELGEQTGPLEVGWVKGVRHELRAVETPLADTETGLELDADAVVLLTGGARGITARVAIELARRHGCTLELVGRSAVPEAEDPALAEAEDAAAIRQALVAGGLRKPAEVEARTRRVLASREIRATLREIDAGGGTASYRSVDVRDAEAFGALVDTIYDERGRIDGVVHGAGVIEDKLIVDKSPESFGRVWDTKVSSALTLADKLRGDLRFLAFFGSVSGVFGNRGQTDYAAANDALDRLAWTLSRRFPDARVLAVDWGPWSGAGMVGPELAREYERRGFSLIEPGAGVAQLLAELGAPGPDAQVILSNVAPEVWSDA